MKAFLIYFIFLITACSKQGSIEKNTKENFNQTTLSSELLITPSSFYVQSKVNEARTFSVYVQNQTNTVESNLLVSLTNNSEDFSISKNECLNKQLNPFESCRVEITVNSQNVKIHTSRLIVGNNKYTNQADFIFKSLPDNAELSVSNAVEDVNINSTLKYNLKNSLVSGEASSFIIVSKPNNGNIDFNEMSGEVEYIPNKNFTGSDFISFKAEDDHGNESNVGILQIIVQESNLTPIAYDQSFSVVDLSPTSFSLLGQDPSNKEIKYIITDQPLKGQIKQTENDYTYIPNKNSTGIDSFKYKVSNGEKESNIATVKINFIKSIEATPIDISETEENVLENQEAEPYPVTSFTTTEKEKKDEPVIFTGTPVQNPTPKVIEPPVVQQPKEEYTISSSNLSMELNEDNSQSITLQSSDSSAQYLITEQPKNGTLSGTAPNLTYTPNPNFHGADSFSYKSFKNGVSSNIATVNLTIKNVNDAPKTQDVSFTTKYDENISMTMPVEDMDNDNNLTFELVSAPVNGVLSGTYPNLIYTPKMYYIGNDSFSFKFIDSNGDASEVSVVNVTILKTSNNYAPVAKNQNTTTEEDQLVNISLDVSDVNDDTLSFTLVQAPSNGTVSFTGTQAIYTPNPNFNGNDSFSYQAKDSQLTSNIAEITVSVNQKNDAPVSIAQNITLNEDSTSFIVLDGTDLDTDNLTYIITEQPQHGTISGTLPNLTYTPNSHYNGSDSFRFKVNDGQDDSNESLISLTIQPVNDTPVADTQTIILNEDEVKNFTITGSDIELSNLNFIIKTQPQHGTLSGTAPNLTYTPNPNYSGNDSFTFSVDDSELESLVVTVNFIINDLNFPPNSFAQNLTTPEDTNVNLTLTGTDPDGDALSFQIINNPSHGTLSGTLPNLTYTPNANYNGSDSFTYVVNDGNLNSSTQIISINITPVNDNPVAYNVSTITNEDDSTTFSLLANDIDNDSLAYIITEQPQNGTLSGTVPNLTYTPNANFIGVDSFKFKVNDGQVDSNEAVVSVNINNVNDTPIANAQNISTNEDTSSNITLTATDLDNDSLTYIITSYPINGTLTGTPPFLTYTPNANYNGADSFSFKVNDGQAESNVVIVSINIDSVNDIPVANAQNITTNEDTPVNITITGTDVDGNSLSHIIVSNPNNGTLSGTVPNLTYTPNPNYIGSDNFTFKVNDGQLDSAISTISINVMPVNDAPVANAQNITTNEDTPVNITITGTDVDGNSLTYMLVSNPSNGTLSGTVPNLTYTPNPNYSGSDFFSFKVNDGQLDSNISNVAITITPVNDAPTSIASNFSTQEDTALHNFLSGSDIDSTTLTYSIIGTPTNGTVTIINPQTGAFTYTPNANYNGNDSFSFIVYDGFLYSEISSVSITVSPVNDAPTSSNLSFTTNKNTPKSAVVTASDLEGETLSYSIVSQATNGTVSMTPDGSFVYTPNNGFVGSDSFTFNANDGSSNSNTATVSINIIQTNVAPIAQNLSIKAYLDQTSVTGQVVATDSDSDPLIYSLVSSVSNLSFNTNGSFTYTIGEMSTWTACATEGSVCNLTGTNFVRYGTTTGYVLKTMTGSFNCNNATFTDPHVGIVKSCTYIPASFSYRAHDGIVNSNIATVTIDFVLRDNFIKISTNPALINASISNFSLMIDLQDLSNIEHFWSNVQDDAGDIVISLADKLTKVPVAIRNFNKATRTGQIWFKSNVVANTKTDFYIHYNNTISTPIITSAPSSTFGAYKVWENNYIGYWDMHFAGSNIQNATSPNLNLTKMVNPVSSYNGHNDQAVQFSSDYFTAPYSDETQLEQEVTISAWVYPTQSIANALILEKEGTDGKDNYALRLNSLKPYFTFDNNCGDKSITSNQSIPLNRWTHITGTFNNTTKRSRIYINGILDTEGSSTTHNHDSISTHPIIIGRNRYSTNENFVGVLDEIKLSARSLSQEWIQLEYNMTNQDNMFWLIDDETVNFMDAFNRTNNTSVGNSWTEYEGCSGNSNLSVFLLGLLGLDVTSANSNCGYMRIESNAVDFYSLDNSQAFPELTRAITNINSGTAKISFDVDFKRTGAENDYGFIINFGNPSKSIGELIWGSPNHGLANVMGFGVVEKSLASIEQIKIINHRETINIVINFNNKTYSVFTKGVSLEDIPFEDPTATLNKISFITNRIMSSNVPIVRIDNLIIKHKP